MLDILPPIRRGYVALFYKPFLDDLRERLRSADHGRLGVARGVPRLGSHAPGKLRQAYRCT